jgi:xanthine dehydrogenase accessory factor
MSQLLENFYKIAHELVESRQTFVCATLIDPEGHVPQDIGAKILVTREGLFFGTIGGGRLEAKVLGHAHNMIETVMKTGRTIPAERIRYDLQTDLGMVCGGAATVFFEIQSSCRWTIAIFGAGHVAQATVPVLAKLDCQVLCFDHRADWIDKLPHVGNVTSKVVDPLAEAVSQTPEDAFFVVMSQGHATDLPIVTEILKRGLPPYLGVIGSVPKARTLKSNLKAAGFSDDMIQAIHCPIGLPIGSNSPQEIAISIAAQLLSVRDLLKLA